MAMSAKNPERAVDEMEHVNVPCACGSKGGANLRRYDLVRCKCGKMYWALRPDRGGPLVAFPWPGQVHQEKS